MELKEVKLELEINNISHTDLRYTYTYVHIIHTWVLVYTYYYYWSNGATCYVCNVLQCILWSVEACGSAIRIIKSTVIYSNAMNTWVPYSILCRYKHLSVVSKYAISYYRLQVSAVCHCLRTVLTKIPPRGARIVKLVGSSISNWWFESCAWRTLGSWAEESCVMTWELCNDLNS